MMNEHSPRLISWRLPSTVWRVRVANSMDWKPTLRICCATILSSGTIFTIPISTVPTSKNLWRQNKVPDLCFGIFVRLKTFRNRITFILYKLIRENCLCGNWTIHNSVFRNPNAIIISAIKLNETIQMKTPCCRSSLTAPRQCSEVVRPRCAWPSSVRNSRSGTRSPSGRAAASWRTANLCKQRACSTPGQSRNKKGRSMDGGYMRNKKNE